jgi:hypothetical protein
MVSAELQLKTVSSFQFRRLHYARIVNESINLVLSQTFSVFRLLADFATCFSNKQAAGVLDVV